MKHCQDQVQLMTNAVSIAILKLINQEKDHQKKKSTKIKNAIIQESDKKNQSIYDELVSIQDKLKKIMKRLSMISKIKKNKLTLYNPKLTQFIQTVSSLIEKKSVSITIDQTVVSLLEQTDKALVDCDRVITLLQKQDGKFSCGMKQDTKYTLYRSIINLIGYGPVWSFIPKISPIIQEKVEVASPQFSLLQRVVETQIAKNWQQKVIEVVRQASCHKPHVDSQILQSKVQQPKTKNQNSIYEEFANIQAALQLQTTLREAHQKLFGFGRPQIIQEAIQAYKASSEKMNPQSALALNALGQIYEEGKFTDSNRHKSDEYYRKSAMLNNPQGLYKTGKYLEKGLIKIPQNSPNYQKLRFDQLKEAIQYYEKAAKMNHLDAITDLGYIYEKGIKNPPISKTLTQKKIEQESVTGSAEQNLKYFVQPNLNVAQKYYKLAAKVEFPRAMNNLGSLLIRMHEQITERVQGTNLQKGIKYLKKAAQLGYLKAYFNLGKCYESGIGVQKNYQNAKLYYQLGSQKGDLSCKVEYLKYFFVGEASKHVGIDDSEMAKLMKIIKEVLILEPNNRECIFYLGLFYQRGEGVVKNPELAYDYVSKAASLNYLPAITKLADYKYSGFYSKKDLPGAVQLYEKAAKEGDAQAMINLSLILQKGLIKPTKGSSPDCVRFLQKQALKTQNSNAYLMAGLKQSNYRLRSTNKNGLNEKILRSAKLGNRDAIYLIEKTRKSQEQWLKKDATIGQSSKKKRFSSYSMNTF